uniref:Uncharacterized protein n=1 Tax=Arcella intermedia TaxID=1963864 RepID=A0A6B2LU56_9EUKA
MELRGLPPPWPQCQAMPREMDKPLRSRYKKRQIDFRGMERPYGVSGGVGQ